MKLLLASLLLASATVIAFAADDTTLTGKWQIHTSVAGNESDSSCAFTQKDSELTGSCDNDRGTVQIKGKVEGKAATWTYKTEYSGSPLTVTFKGTRDAAGKITGSVVAEEFGVEGEFTATPAK